MKKSLSVLLAVLITLSTMLTASVTFSAQEVTSKSMILGDSNLDRKVNVKDATEVQKATAMLITFTEHQNLLSDVDENTRVNVVDATLIQKYSAGMDTPYRIGEEITASDPDATDTATSSDSSIAETLATDPTDTSPAETSSENPSENTSEPIVTTAETDSTDPVETSPLDESLEAVKVVYSDTKATLYNSAGDEISTASNVNVTNDTFIEIVTPLSIEISGSCKNGQICVNIDKTKYSGTASAIEITLAGLTLSAENDSPIYVKAVDDYCTISVKKGTVNTISDGSDYLNEDSDAAAIYAKDDLKIKGKGTLNVNGNCAYGICAKDDLKLWNGTINIKSVGTGVKGKDSVRIGDPDDIGTSGAFDSLVITIDAGEDGIRSNNSTDEGKGFITINGGTVTINSLQDGIQAEQALTINGGNVNITTYKGSASKVTGDLTAKGIKCEGTLDLLGGTVTVDSSDDSIHCGDALTIKDGTYTLSSADDGIHSDNTVIIDGGSISVTKSYEALEGMTITINGGRLDLYSTDDGVNAAGGNDASSPSFPFRGSQSSSSGYIYINGGEIFVNASGDGLDSNGSISMTGGLVVVSGAENSGNGAIDYDVSFTMSGGTLVATGSSGMAQNISSANGVCSAMINLSTTQSSGTMIAINDASGNNLVTVKSPKKFNNIVFASADLKTGTTYTLYTGGSYSGKNILDRYFYDGTYTPGSSLLSYTQSSAIYGSTSGGGSRPGRP